MTKDKTKHNCLNCSAFGKHCPHKVNGDPYHYDCGMTVEELEKENSELKECNKMLEQGYVWHDYDAGEDCYEDTHEGKWVKREEVYQLTKAKEIIREIMNWYWETDICSDSMPPELRQKAEQFLNSEVEK